jgi:hypothetical protein
VGILTSRYPDTPEGLESRLFVKIHRIPTELPHSTELELRKLRRTRMDSGRASTLELLRGLPTSQEVLRPSEPHLSLYSTKIEFGSPLGRGLNLTFFTPSIGRSTGVFIGALSRCFDLKWGSGGPLLRLTSQLGCRAAKFHGQTNFGHWIPRAPTLLDTLAKWNLKRRQHLVPFYTY